MSEDPRFPRRALAGDPTIERILLIKWSALGDIVMASAAFEDVARAFPGRRIDLNVLPPWHRLFDGDARFEHVWSHDLRGRAGGVRGHLRWLRDMRAARYDLVVDLQSSDHTRILLGALVALGCAPRYRVGTHQRFPWNVAPAPLPGPPNAAAYAQAALAEAGIPSLSTRPVLAIDASARERAERLLAEHALERGRFAVFLPGSQAAGHLKRWGAERYAALAILLAERGVPRVVLIGGPDEREECAQLAAAAPRIAVDLCGRTSIAEIVPICEASAFIVGNDTGTGHVAAAAGRPLLVICGPTDPRRVRPLGERVRTLQADLPCINCYAKTCSHHSCMRQMTPVRVLDALNEWLPDARGDPAAPASTPAPPARER